MEEWLPFNLESALAQTVATRGVERAVEKHGSPIQPEALIHDLHLPPSNDGGGGEAVRFLTHLQKADCGHMLAKASLKSYGRRTYKYAGML